MSVRCVVLLVLPGVTQAPGGSWKIIWELTGLEGFSWDGSFLVSSSKRPAWVATHERGGKDRGGEGREREGNEGEERRDGKEGERRRGEGGERLNSKTWE